MRVSRVNKGNQVDAVLIVLAGEKRFGASAILYVGMWCGLGGLLEAFLVFADVLLEETFTDVLFFTGVASESVCGISSDAFDDVE
jgi:hypothetical protein